MISRIQSLKSQLLDHEGLFKAELSSKLPLRLAFMGLLSCCDCEGHFQWQIRPLKVAILPYDIVDMSSVLEALCQAGVIKQYKHEGVLYGCISSWDQPQCMNHREAQSLCPALEQFIPTSDEHPLENNEINRSPDGCFTKVKPCLGTLRHARGEGKGRSLVPARSRCTQTLAVRQIFEHWKRVMDHPNAVLDPKRRNLISNALMLGYSREQLCQAITGCSLTAHNWGDNDRGTRYDGLHIILRDADQIDRFMHNAQNPPCAVTTADRLRQNNKKMLKGWADRKRWESKDVEDSVYEV